MTTAEVLAKLLRGATILVVARDSTAFAWREDALAALATWEAEKASEQQAERLSDEEIKSTWNAHFVYGGGDDYDFARAIESACAAKWGVKLSSQEGTQP